MGFKNLWDSIEKRRLMKTCVTLVAHGSSREEANLFMKELAQKLTSPFPFNLGFLEVASPHMREALEEHIRKGATQIRVIPLFLVPGNHVDRDIPAIIKEVSQKYPEILIDLEDFIGKRDEFFSFLIESLSYTRKEQQKE